jgi:hypothetical protein
MKESEDLEDLDIDVTQILKHIFKILIQKV